MIGKVWEKRTHYCGSLRIENVGQDVILNGWVQGRRDHGGVIFIDVRDVSGIVQVVFNPGINASAHERAGELRGEYVVSCRGKVNPRPDDSVNAKLPTGDVEVMAEEVSVISASLTPPFEIQVESDVDEGLRLRYRYLDIRRPDQLAALALKSALTSEVRSFLEARSFLEIETPILTKSTPEGARDFVVPSRLQPGEFYALPQSPQLFKQLLMVAGVDRYYQIARCFRDEDMRADRQLEFTQIDIEMSFIEPEDILAIMDEMFVDAFRSVLGVDLHAPFPRMSWKDVMENYGTDRPDPRWGMVMSDFSPIFANTEFKLFRSVLAEGGRVRGFRVEGLVAPPRRELDALVEEAQRLGAGGLVWMVREGESLRSPVSKFLTEKEIQDLISEAAICEGAVLLLAAGSDLDPILSGLRQYCIDRFAPEPVEPWSLLWVVDFPLFGWDETEKRYKSNHHPFTSPSRDSLDVLATDPLAATSDSYDMVLNGVEIGGGSIRIHDPELQDRIFQILGLGQEEVADKFGFLLEAFRYGAPPHGGIAYGLDRLAMLMAGKDSIRDVIAFPKTQSGLDPMTGAPDIISQQQLRELHMKTT